jgi:uncharacterized protein YodC (DUF2158 family)
MDAGLNIKNTNMDKIFFSPGDVVTIKALSNAPIMLVADIKKARLRDEQGLNKLLGITCYWFTKDGIYQEQTFSTKDLVRV